MRPDWDSPLGTEIRLSCIILLLLLCAAGATWLFLTHPLLSAEIVGGLLATIILWYIGTGIYNHIFDLLADEHLYQMRKKKDNAWEAQNIPKRKEDHK